MTTLTYEQHGYISILEDLAATFQKVQVNFKKCSKTRLTEGYVKARLESINEYWISFNKTHLELTKCTSREQRGEIPYFHNEEYYKYEEMYLGLKADMLDILEKSKSNKNKDDECCKKSASGTSDVGLASVKLPRIQLPYFTGKYEEFPTYKDLFTSLVHDNTSLSNVQKLHYLKTSVTGEAEVLLRHIQITDSNYLQAWDLLKSRYGNKRLISTSVFKKLFNQKKINNQSAPSIKSLMDTTTECLNSLQNLGISTDSWDPMIVFLVVQKLDTLTHKEWEEHSYSSTSDELPKWNKLKAFLEAKFRTLELVTPSTSSVTTREKISVQKSFHVSNEAKRQRPVATDEAQVSCAFCKGNHHIFNCKDYAKQSVEDRHEFALKNNLCFNCLISNHNVFRCKQPTSCRICKRRHHSLLHLEKKQTSEDDKAATQINPQTSETQVTAHYSREEQPDQQVLLATALVNVTSSSGESHVFRALIDQGSEASFVTARVVELLRLKRTEVSGTVSGVGEGKQSIKHKVDLSILSNNETIEVKAYVMKTISSNLPAKEVRLNRTELQNLTLADPSCCTPGKIDILLGADVFARIIEDGLIRLQSGLVVQKTRFGWILSGQTNNPNSNQQRTITSLFVREDNDMLKRFWEIETDLYTKKKILTKEEEECEAIYSNTTKRDKDGRYIVHLPLKQTEEETKNLIGETKQKAMNRFKQLEKKFEKNEKFKEDYAKVIDEYLQMDHMKKVEDKDNENLVYLPHHAVVREDKDTTKVRAVFDASCKGTQGNSLNDTMMVGPVLQPDLRSLIITWRKYKICIVGDIVKMYRMVMVAEEHKNLQCILWRNNQDEDLETYKLQTVTFGTAAAPFLAVRTLNQLADDEAHDYPEAATVIKESFYMDDLMTGDDDVPKVKKLCHDIKEVLRRGGFTMQKWSSNSEEVLQFIQEGEKNMKNELEIKLDKIIKILGLTWDRKEDKFKIKVNLPEMKYPVTKRTILSDVARLFDPFGWLSPVVIIAKIMIQKLWLCNLGWDNELPPELVEEWTQYRESLTDLRSLEVPRWLQTSPTNKEVQVHGFSDASLTSYAAVTYLRVVDEEDKVHVTMIASRTRVAPLKQLTIPRLELCASALLADLIKDVTQLLHVPMDNVYAYTDSMVVLSWLQSQPNKWHTFVANRVADILRVLDNSRWRHIKSNENPADVATRGLKACDIERHDLWWTGPGWLKSKKIDQSRCDIPPTELEMKKSFHTYTAEDKENKERPIWERFSSISRMKRVLAYCRRFCNAKDKRSLENYITQEEMEGILQSCIKYYQDLVYRKDIEAIKKEGRVKKRSTLASLSPFLDKNGVMKVEGRLQKADALESFKHPIIIPQNVHLAKLLIKEAHTKTLHGGIQAMMVYIRSKYWVIGLKSAVRKFIRTCKVCIIDKAKVKTQKMGQLPAVRVNQHRAFLNSGVDYAGPVYIRTSKGRGHHATKGYICLFVCMATRAIHLEAVTDLTSQAFIAAFRRFVARRGSCAHLWSDNGTNFVGAAKELKHLFEKGKDNMAREIAELLANDGTTWHFIPPKMPNYGGLWEAGVQSAKRHLTRVNGAAKLTYEEMATLLAQIEACLNSRPLCQLDHTTETLNPLTPGHFLVGEALISVPDIHYKNKNINLLTRWQMIQKMTQDFWGRWQSEYLNTMQQRYKWQDSVPSPNVGNVVVIKEDDLPPTKWLLGRVKIVHPGADNLVRVVTVQCKGNHEMKRPLSKLILLPNEPENC